MYLGRTSSIIDNIFHNDHHREMKSYFKSEYKNDHEYAYLNWLEGVKTQNKKKVFSLAFLVSYFLPKKTG